MIPAAHALTAELEREAVITRRVLERVRQDTLAWRPHGKSMSVAQLANHIATIPGGIAHIAALDGLDASTVNFEPPAVERADALLPTLESSVEAAKSFLAGLTDATAAAPWRLTSGDQEIFTIPRIDLMRALALNHWYHHRGQLSVYLRLLDVPVPVIYGRSADENPFARAS